MTVKELITELTHNPEDAEKRIYISTKDVTSQSNTTHNVGEVVFYKNSIVIYASAY